MNWAKLKLVWAWIEIQFKIKVWLIKILVGLDLLYKLLSLRFRANNN
jgi:hypothetical protein